MFRCVHTYLDKMKWAGWTASLLLLLCLFSRCQAQNTPNTPPIFDEAVYTFTFNEQQPAGEYHSYSSVKQVITICIYN